MGKKGKGKKKSKKDSEPTEPPHDPGWERAVEQGRWDRPIDALPDPNAWPTWGALRERIILSCMTIRVTWSPTVSDSFASEVVKLAPPDLAKISFRGSANLSKFVLSPLTACPLLKEVDLALSPNLEFVLIQSESVENVLLSRCGGVKKLLLHCNNLSSLNIDGCTSIETIMIWSSSLETLDLSGCTNLMQCKIHCPNLKESHIPELKAKSVVTPQHPPIAKMLAKEMFVNETAQRQENGQGKPGNFDIPVVFSF